MKVWIICVIAFFSIAELCQWLQAQELPVYGAAGLLLAAAANPKRWRHLLPSFSNRSSQSSNQSSDQAMAQPASKAGH